MLKRITLDIWIQDITLLAGIVEKKVYSKWKNLKKLRQNKKKKININSLTSKKMIRGYSVLLVHHGVSSFYFVLTKHLKNPEECFFVCEIFSLSMRPLPWPEPSGGVAGVGK